MSTTQTTQAHKRIDTTRELVWELNRSCLETGVQQEKEREWLEVNRTEGQDQERMERILTQLIAGPPNGIKDRRRARAKTETDSRDGVVAAKTGPGKSRCFVTNKCKSFWKRRNKKLVNFEFNDLTATRPRLVWCC